MGKEGPLQGITVVELSTFVAAPVTARLLSDMGAEVIKVERLEGDTWRATSKSFLPFRFSDEQNPVFDIYNSGKRHVALNIKTVEGMEALHRLIEKAQVFVTNTRPAALKRLGLDPDTLRQRYPGLVYGLLLGYGEEGPDADLPAFDTSAFWARSGFLRDLSLRQEGYAPVQAPYSMGDTISGYLLTMEICAALLRREKTGKGDIVKSSLFHNSIFTMGTMEIITQGKYCRQYPEDRASWGTPGGSYQCADGEWILISGYSAAMHPILLKMIEREWLITDPRFQTPLDKWENRHKYYEIVRDAILEKPSAYWLEEAHRLDLPIMKLGHFSDLSTDPQAWANGYLEKVQFASGNVDIMPTSPIEMKSVGELKTVPAEGVGAHTRRVLAELGYTDEQIEAMMAAGAAK